jgi:hypothetical protein
MRVRYLAALLAATVLTVSCGSVTDPSQNKTESFNGTITPVSLGGTGTAQVPFNISNGGEYTVKVTTMTPTFNNYFQAILSLGCGGGIVQNNTLGIVGAQALSGPVVQTGGYCVTLVDAYNVMTAVENFTVVISHP